MVAISHELILIFLRDLLSVSFITVVLAVKQEVINSLRLVAGVAILGVTWVEAMEMCPKATVPNSQPGYSGFCCSVFV